MLSITATRLRLDGDRIIEDPRGDLREAVVAHLRGEGPPGLVIVGAFGSGKTTLCDAIAATPSAGARPATVVPLRLVARHDSLEAGLRQTVGKQRLDEVRNGERVLLLDGLDEIAGSGERSFPELFDALTAAAGERWILTSRPGHFRTDPGEPESEQVDVLERADVDLVSIDPLPAAVAQADIGTLPGGAALLHSVDGLRQLATSPLLLHAVHAALPFIDPGRPIHPWGVFDAWIRHSLHSGPDHDRALTDLQTLAWSAFAGLGFSVECPRFSHEAIGRLELPAGLRALLVTDLDGALRFGHRSVYEFLVASRIALRLVENQDQGPDELSGVRITEAMRAFLVGRPAPMPVTYAGDRVRIPAGNFIAGGDLSPDERPLRIQHLAQPIWIARAPVTNQEWARFLADRPDDRIDAHYLRHWGIGRTLPPGREKEPVHHLWPEDADAYAAWSGARLPTANEWEKAVRGIDGRRWPWGDYFVPKNAVTGESGVERPLPVTAFGAHGEAGLFSPIGGVFEYTSSSYRDRPNRGRIVMGGCYTHPASTSRASLRLSHKLSGNLKAGVRLAWNAT